MINIGDAVLYFKGDMSDLDRALGEARRSAEDNLGNMKQMAAEVGMAMTAMGAAILGGMTASVVGIANTADDINDMSMKIGFSTETVSKWAFALGQSGGDVSLLQTGVRGLANQIDTQRQAMAEAAMTGEVTSSVFDRLGISLTDLAVLAPEDQFMRMALAVAAIPDPLERAAVAQDVFGKAGMDLLPVLAGGEAGLREMFDQAERAGAVFTAAEAAMGDNFNDALGELQASLMGAGKQLAIVLIPSMIELIGTVKEVVINVKDWASANPAAFQTLVTGAAAVGVFMSTVGPLLMILPGLVTAVSMLSGVFTALGGVFAVVAGAVSAPVLAIVAGIAAIGAAAYALYAYWDEIPGMLGGVFAAIESGVGYSVEKLGEFAGWVGGNLVQAMTDPVTFISEYWSWLGSVFDYIILKIGQGWDWLMTNVIEPGWQYLKDFYNWITGIFSESFAGAFSAASSSPSGEPIPGMATGGVVAKGGLSWVGERGPEIVYMPTGAQVIPADQSAALAAGAGSTVNINFGSVQVPDRAAAHQLARVLGEELTRRVSARGLRGAV
jgi:hypothetical protein